MQVIKTILGILLIGSGIMNTLKIFQATDTLDTLEYVFAIIISFVLGYFLLRTPQKQ